MTDFKTELSEKGYAVIEDVLKPEQIKTAITDFREWIDKNPQVKEKHSRIDPHGIFKFSEAGHQRHTWYIKTLDEVQSKFRDIWETNELVTGFDGSCWMPSSMIGKDGNWTHTDQAPDTKGRVCVQGFIALTNNKERTLQVYEGSHLLHEQYMREKEITGKKNWLLIEPAYLKTIEDKKKVLNIKAGSLVLWDSRTFHQNRNIINTLPGQPNEERMVQYVCFLPKNHPKNTANMSKKRLKYYEDRRTTSHWPYPLHVNGKQPQTFGNDNLLIDYEQLIPPYLDDLDEKIKKII
jgi:hypothetical protein